MQTMRITSFEQTFYLHAQIDAICRISSQLFQMPLVNQYGSASNQMTVGAFSDGEGFDLYFLFYFQNLRYLADKRIERPKLRLLWWVSSSFCVGACSVFE